MKPLAFFSLLNFNVKIYCILEKGQMSFLTNYAEDLKGKMHPLVDNN